VSGGARGGASPVKPRPWHAASRGEGHPCTASSPYEYLPFGGGTRRCIGAAFALFEMKVVLGTLLGLAEFRRLPSARPNALVRRNLTMGPADGIPLELVARRAR
jgi:cytochrome P450